MNPIPDNKLAEIKSLLLSGNKIAAIKLHRELTGLGLAESKRVIDRLEAEMRSTIPEQFTKPVGKGCVSVALTVSLIFGPVVYVASHLLQVMFPK